MSSLEQEQRDILITNVLKITNNQRWISQDNFEFTEASKYDSQFDDYDFQFNKLQDYQYMQLIDVIIGKKPMCLIENDYYPDFNDCTNLINDMNAFQSRLFTEFIALKNCGLLRFILDRDDDPTCLYFYEENWINALILYLYNDDKYERLFKDLDHDIFLGILLGYSVTSCINYSISLHSNEYYSEKKFERKKELYLSNKDRITKLYNHTEKVILSLKKQILDLTEKGNYTYYNMICGKKHPNQLIDIDLYDMW